MMMTRSFGISAAIHVFLLGIMILIGFTGKSTQVITETVKIRIRMPGNSNAQPSRVLGSAPSESFRDYRQPVTIPPVSTSNTELAPKPGSGPVRGEVRTLENPVVSRGPEVPGIEASFRTLPDIDPLEGLVFPINDGDDNRPGSSNNWALTWANGRERGIISFPEVDSDSFPESTERLLDVRMAIQVSPQGDVISAEVLQPGSGDVRIDRYMHSLALKLVLEPRLTGEDIQQGIIRLIFTEGSGE